MKNENIPKFVPIETNFNTELFENSYSLIDSVMSNAVKQIQEEYDKYLVKALRAVGHEFETRKELVDFIATRCSKGVIQRQPNVDVFLIDGKQVFMIKRTIKTNFEGSNAEASCTYEMQLCS